jgi:transcription elongation GreA/GreB family factor
MSRAFVREDGPDNAPLPDLPVSPRPNHVTPQGLAQLRDRLADAMARLRTLRARAERLDPLPEAAAERDIRYLEARLRSAILVEPGAEPPDAVIFGARVTVALADGTTRALRIVGEDEADAATGAITAHSPLGRALMGARVGDSVLWPKPSGPEEIEIVAIAPGPAA